MKLICIAMLITLPLCAQVPYNNAIPNGYTKQAMVAEEVGLGMVSITYHRPGVKGREGNIWGKLVHNGFADLGFGSRNPAPWRAGANENTIFETMEDIKIEGRELKKGRYGFFVAYGEKECMIIFSRVSDSWGSFFYDQKDDALRVNVKPEPLTESVEYLTYAFTDPSPNSVTIKLSWEKMAIPFRVEADLRKQQFAALESDLKNPRSFTAQALTSAASWCLQNNYELEKGLEWASLATGRTFPGDPTSFAALITKADLYFKTSRLMDAKNTIDYALAFGTINQLMQYGQRLLRENRTDAGFTVLEYNYKKNPRDFLTRVGMAKAYAAKGDYNKALSFARKGLEVAPEKAAKESIEKMIKKLEAKEVVN